MKDHDRDCERIHEEEEVVSNTIEIGPVRILQNIFGRKIGRGFTSNVSYAGTTKHSNELAGGASVVTDRDDVAQGAIVPLDQFVEDIDKTVGGTAARKDDNLPRWSVGHVEEYIRGKREGEYYFNVSSLGIDVIKWL